jgi:nucleotide-binding universal stress UspA family protein
MLTIRTILHPTDLSECSQGAFQAACSLTRQYDARLIVLHVVPLPVVMYGPPPANFVQHLRDELCRTRPGDPNTHVQHLLAEGDPANAILSAARESHCDLIVMATHGRRGLSRLVLGSVAEAVLRRAPCPVLLVKGPIPLETTGAAEAAREPAAV